MISVRCPAFLWVSGRQVGGWVGGLWGSVGVSNYRLVNEGSNFTMMAGADTGVFVWVIGNPTAVCNFFLLVDLPRALQQFGSAPEIPVRTPPPPSECTTPPPPSESWIRAWMDYDLITP